MHRQLQETEVYSKLYYKSRIKPVVREHLSIAGSVDHAINIVKSTTKNLWIAEDEEIKRAVAAEIARARNVVIPSGEVQRTTQQYQE
jgi:hypothetical protein